ncbi:HIT-like domain-containing protein [Xylariomycetidae sp. FL0641]|nr:HIT-like domain-containing protein [Xylariomycetidae sp. FL0641]
MIRSGGKFISISTSPSITLGLARKMSSNTGGPVPVHFGPFEVTSQVFLTTPYSFALVNLKPLLPGHVLVCPRAPHRRLTDLQPAEVTDLFTAVQRVQRMLARHYFAASKAAASGSDGAPVQPEDGSFNIAVQDGAEAGQTVAHVHVHVIPRIRGATAKDTAAEGDEMYENMAAEPGNVGGALWDRQLELHRGRPRPGGAFPRIEDKDRHPRSLEEMEAEAKMFQRVLADMEGS